MNEKSKNNISERITIYHDSALEVYSETNIYKENNKVVFSHGTPLFDEPGFGGGGFHREVTADAYNEGIEELLEKGKCDLSKYASGTLKLEKSGEDLIIDYGEGSFVFCNFNPKTLKLNKYIIKGVEEVYDAFDEFEHNNPLDPIEVVAASIDEAVNIAREKFQQEICKQRLESGHISSLQSSSGPHGMYFAHVNEVVDMDGKSVYQDYVERT